MSENIPRGRQRSSSEGDLLDEDEEEINYGPHGLSPLHRKVSRSVHFRTSDRNEYIETVAQREYSTLDRKKKYKRPSFRAMKNSVLRMVRRNVNSNDENNAENDSSYNVRAIVTPTLRRKGKAGELIAGRHQANNTHLISRQDESDNVDYNGSVNRPLFTQRIIKLKGGVTPGTVGLTNHGNTCFMNAIIQCLCHTDALAEYFITEQYKTDIARHNKSNAKKFGTKGEVLEQMAYLVHSLWDNRYTPEISNHFKNVVGKYNNQYQGYSQHDAQEFLLWLLDKMHEDLNTVARKKYKANKTHSPRPDEDLAEEATAYSKSFVCDLFQALYRSSLICLNCNRQSNTFDPYLCVSLPLPQKLLRPVYVIIVYADARPKQVKIGLQCNIHDTVKDLRRVLASDTNIPESRLILAQIYDDGFRNTYSDHQPLSDIPESETVYAIELLPIINPEEYQTSFIQILFVNVEKVSSPSRCYRFSSPQFMQVPRDLNFKELQTQILKHMYEDIREGVLSQAQRLSVLFRLRVVDGIPGKCHLNPDVEMPLYMQTVDRAMSFAHKRGSGPPHLKLVVEWDPHTKESLVMNDEDHIEEHSSVQQIRQSQQRTSGASLDECFQLYTQEEKLSGDDAWLCPYCKKQQQGTMKKLGLWSLPDVFVVHLKRFKQTGMRRNKLNTLVNFPVTGLNMSSHLVERTINNNNRYCDPSTSSSHSIPLSPDSQMALLGGSQSEQDLYDLFAVCNHYGDMCGGHYTAFCKNPVDEKWYTFDDPKVSAMSEADVVNKAAYLLFYQRRNRFQNRFHELQQGNHWVFNLEDLVDPASLGQYVSPPGSPSKTRTSRTSVSPGTSRKRSPGPPSQGTANPTPDLSPMQRHYSMPPSMRQQPRNPAPSSSPGPKPETPYQPTSPPPTNSILKPSANLASKPPNGQTKLPQNHTVTFNVNEKFTYPDRPAQLYVTLPRERSSGRSLSGGSPKSRSPGSVSPSNRSSLSDRSPTGIPPAPAMKPTSVLKSTPPVKPPPIAPPPPVKPRPDKNLSPIPYADEHRPPTSQTVVASPQKPSQEPVTGYRPTPRSKSHDNFRPDDAIDRNGGSNNPKYNTLGRLERSQVERPHVDSRQQLERSHVDGQPQVERSHVDSRPHVEISHVDGRPQVERSHVERPHAERVAAINNIPPREQYHGERSLNERQNNYTRVISPQPFVGETRSLDRYPESSDRFPRYQPQRHYAYLRYTHARQQARPVEIVQSPNCLKESSV